MLHWDQMSFLRERGEKILAKKQTLETTMDMEVAHTLPWRWTINAVVAAMTILLLLSCVALCVCVRFFWLQLAGLSIRMSSETHTHTITDRSQVALGFQRGDSAGFKIFRPSARERRT